MALCFSLIPFAGIVEDLREKKDLQKWPLLDRQMVISACQKKWYFLFSCSRPQEFATSDLLFSIK